MKRAAVLLVVVLLCAACIPGVKAGRRCSTSEWGDDGVYALKCENGRWVRKATKAQVAQLLIALAKSRQTTTTTTTVPAAPTTTVDPNPSGTATAVGVGDGSSCALIADGRVKCWGQDRYGQLGDGTVFQPVSSTSAQPVVGVTTATALAVGLQHACAVLAGGSVTCWGSDTAGQMADGTLASPDENPTPHVVAGVTGAVSIAAGSAHTCALLANATVQCWGADSTGQIGDGTVGSPAFSAPNVVPGLTNVIAIAAGGGSTCAIVTGGAVKCWGSDDHGELGDGTNGTPTTNPSPVAVVGITNAIALGARGDVTCAALQTGAVKCWGNDEVGGIGDGTIANPLVNPSPVDVIGVAGASRITVGDAVCALVAGGIVKCWGYDGDGELGDGTVGPNSGTPATVATISSATAVTAGTQSTCAVVAGAVWCWGSNDRGQLGNGHVGSPNAQPTPAAVLGI